VRPQKPIGAEICTPGCGRATVFQVTPGFSRGDNLLTIPGVAEPHSINAGVASHGKAVTLDVSPVWPAKPTCGVESTGFNRGIGASGSVAFDNANHIASFISIINPACRLRRARFVKFESKFDFGLLK